MASPTGTPPCHQRIHPLQGGRLGLPLRQRFAVDPDRALAPIAAHNTLEQVETLVVATACSPVCVLGWRARMICSRCAGVKSKVPSVSGAAAAGYCLQPTQRDKPVPWHWPRPDGGLCVAVARVFSWLRLVSSVRGRCGRHFGRRCGRCRSGRCWWCNADKAQHTLGRQATAWEPLNLQALTRKRPLWAW